MILGNFQELPTRNNDHEGEKKDEPSLAQAVEDSRQARRMENFLQEQQIEILVQKMREGDPNCKFKIGTRVEKAYSEPGDIHATGSKGVILGSGIFNGNEAYLVGFDDEPEVDGARGVAFMVVHKLAQIED